MSVVASFGSHYGKALPPRQGQRGTRNIGKGVDAGAYMRQDGELRQPRCEPVDMHCREAPIVCDHVLGFHADPSYREPQVQGATSPVAERLLYRTIAAPIPTPNDSTLKLAVKATHASKLDAI